jgi:NADP-dependent 3-hydroxy acid dehydrogenase YdfG
MLARSLVARGHAVRGTTRDPARLSDIEAVGAQARLADPDRVATMVPAFEHVTVACVLLGSAAGTDEQLAALHSHRLQAALVKMIDTTIHGVVYERRGTVAPGLLGGGAKLVRSFSDRSLAACAMLDADPDDHEAWVAAALAAVERVLERG